eukprot:3935140-Rhodomonas_salina.1
MMCETTCFDEKGLLDAETRILLLLKGNLFFATEIDFITEMAPFCLQCPGDRVMVTTAAGTHYFDVTDLEVKTVRAGIEYCLQQAGLSSHFVFYTASERVAAAIAIGRGMAGFRDVWPDELVETTGFSLKWSEQGNGMRACYFCYIEHVRKIVDAARLQWLFCV